MKSLRTLGEINGAVEIKEHLCSFRNTDIPLQISKRRQHRNKRQWSYPYARSHFTVEVKRYPTGCCRYATLNCDTESVQNCATLVSFSGCLFARYTVNSMFITGFSFTNYQMQGLPNGPDNSRQQSCAWW